MSYFSDDDGSSVTDRVVVQYDDSVVKGYADRSQWPPAGETFEPGWEKELRSLRVKRDNSENVEDLSLEDAKAVFFVRSFRGEESHADLRFHDHLQPRECLWVRVVFTDGEMVEGMINNARDYVLEPGFFMTPIDPDSNNWLLYILKAKVKDFEVLGLRHRLKNHHSLKVLTLLFPLLFGLFRCFPHALLS